jgi:hypothetical protein
MFKNLSLSWIMWLIPLFAAAQTGSIKGFVYDRDNGEPIIFTNVYLKGTTFGIATDVNGFYNLTRIPPGSYTLMVTFVGYDTASVNLKVEAGKVISQDLWLKVGSVQLDETVVSADR